MQTIPPLSQLAGPAHLTARKLYRALVAHYSEAQCLICKSYPQHDCMIVQGDLLEHLADFVSKAVHSADLIQFINAKLIEIEHISARQHRIVF